MGMIERFESMFKPGYGENFRQLRESRNLTLVEMGNKVYYSDKTISLIETEERTPTLDQLIRYHEVLNVPYEYLFGETHELFTDISTQFISSETGLSGSAIKNLNSISHYKKSDYDYQDLISLIISDRGFFSLCHLAFNYLTLPSYRKNTNKTIDSISDIPDLPSFNLAFDAGVQFIKILESITPDYLNVYVPIALEQIDNSDRPPEEKKDLIDSIKLNYTQKVKNPDKKLQKKIGKLFKKYEGKD